VDETTRLPWARNAGIGSCVCAGALGEAWKMTWHPGDIYRAWDDIHHALNETMKELPRESLQFLAFRAADPIIRHKAAEVLDWLNNREALPDWGWFTQTREERLRCQF
jgi:hypothetical protein